MMGSKNEEMPDKMTPVIAVLGYGAAAVVIALLFLLAAPVV